MGFLDSALSFLGIGSDVYGAKQSVKAQKLANETNIKLSREQRAWEEQLANSAVQRKKADYIKAGFNPVLAALGTGASTPSVAAPTVEPTFRAEWTKGSTAQAAMLQAQLKNINANTVNTAAQARKTAVEADIAEKSSNSRLEYEVKRNVERYDQEALKTQIMKEQHTSSAAEAARLRRTVDSMVAKAAQDARTGQLNLEALENIASVGGIEAGAAKGIIQLILDAWRVKKMD